MGFDSLKEIYESSLFQNLVDSMKVKTENPVISEKLIEKSLTERPVFFEKLSESNLEFQDITTLNVKPFVLKDRILMSPGTWNEKFYDFSVLEKAIQSTKFDRKNSSLFLDHDDESTSKWIGEVKNIRLDGEKVKGDLYIIDKDTAEKIAYLISQEKVSEPTENIFGISPKLSANENGGIIHDFIFENFSIVLNPAVKTAYINKEIKKEDKKMDFEFASVEELSYYLDFAKKFLDENPGKTMKDAAEAWKAKKQEMSAKVETPTKLPEEKKQENLSNQNFEEEFKKFDMKMETGNLEVQELKKEIAILKEKVSEEEAVRKSQKTVELKSKPANSYMEFWKLLQKQKESAILGKK